jgi:hypothetical protein
MFDTESERKVRKYRIIHGDEEVFDDGYGYIYFKRANSQEIHQGEGICRVLFCIDNLSVKEDNSETGAVTYQGNYKLDEMIISIFYNNRREKNNLASSSSNNNVVEASLFVTYLKKFLFARAFTWLLILLIISEAVILSDEVSLKSFESYFKGVRDGVEPVLDKRGGIGMSLVLIMPFYEHLDFCGFNSSTLCWSWLNAFSYPPGGQIKSTFHTIEHPAVISGQRSPFSSEDG